MRRAVALLFVLLGLATAGVAVAMATAFAPEDTVTATARLDEPGAAIVTEPGVLELAGSPVQVRARRDGEGPVLLAIGRDAEVEAYLADVSRTAVTGLTPERELRTQAQGSEPSLPDPAGSDLWMVTASGDGEAELTWADAPGRWRLLAVTDGRSPTPVELSLTWPNDTDTPLVMPLALTGGLAIMAGLLLLVVPGRRPARSVPSTAMAAAAMALVAGCGEPVPEPSPDAVPTRPAPVVTQDQVERVLSGVEDTVAVADEAEDADLLTARVTGPAAAMREADYRVRQGQGESAEPVTPLELDALTAIVPTMQGWPRFFFAAAEMEGGAVPQLLVLTSSSARENYRLWGQLRLLPGATLPAVSGERAGEPLDADAAGLVATPQEVATRYADVLTRGEDSEFADAFADDTFAEQILARAVADTEELSEVGAATVTHSAQPDQLYAVRTDDGGALVVAGLQSVTAFTVREGSVRVPDDLAVLAGSEDEVATSLTTTTAELVAFHVPADGGGQIDVLAAAEGVVAVEGS